MTGPRFLMCPPRHYGVRYTINPWMNPGLWAQGEADWLARAGAEWRDLRRALQRLGATIDEAIPAASVPDLVFTANSAVVMDGKALLARFKHPERQRERPYYAAAFRSLIALGLLDVAVDLPEGVILEGAGDCIWDQTRRLFWVGSGLRSQATAATVVAETFGLPTVGLDLVDPRFYHLDTTFSVLPRGEIMCFPGGLSKWARRILAERVDADDRLEVGEADACSLALNGIGLGDTLVLSACSGALRSRLAERGYRVIVQPLSAFLLSGGAAYCLTLRTDLRSAAPLARPDASAAGGLTVAGGR